MDNPETLATLSTQYTGWRQAPQKHKKRRKRNERHGPHQKPGGVNTCAREGLAVPASCRIWLKTQFLHEKKIEILICTSLR